jgi:hypothetical protein
MGSGPLGMLEQMKPRQWLGPEVASSFDLP